MPNEVAIHSGIESAAEEGLGVQAMPSIIPIADPSDPRIEPYRDIRERDLVRRDGLFVAEGKVVIEKLLGSNFYAPQSLLVARHRLGSLSGLLDRVPDGVEVYAASQAIFDEVAGFPVHRGLLAIGRRTEKAGSAALLGALPERATVLLLTAIANHDNMGGIFRNAAAFGADLVLVDSDCCDPLYRKAIRVSVGASLLVPWARLDRNEDGVELLAAHGFVCYGLTPVASSGLADFEPGPRTALILGAEGPGMTPSDLQRSEALRIEMVPGFDSLNVATASGIALHHLLARRSR